MKYVLSCGEIEDVNVGDEVSIKAAVIAVGGGIALLAASTVRAMKPTGSKLNALMRGIAKAEGFFVTGSVAQRANNPGNLKAGNRGLGTIGGKTIFPSVVDGWRALAHQIDLIASGKSAFYRPDMTFAQIAHIYTGGDKPDAWAAIVTQEIGVTPDTIFVQWWLA